MYLILGLRTTSNTLIKLTSYSRYCKKYLQCFYWPGLKFSDSGGDEFAWWSPGHHRWVFWRQKWSCGWQGHYWVWCLLLVNIQAILLALYMASGSFLTPEGWLRAALWWMPFRDHCAHHEENQEPHVTLLSRHKCIW